MASSKFSKFLALFLGQGFNTVINFLFLPYLARAMSMVEYGTYGQSLLVVDTLQLLFAAGLGKVLFAFYAEQKNRPEDIILNNVLASFFLGSIAFIFIFLSAEYVGELFKNEQLPFLIKVYAISIPFQIIGQSFNTSLIYFDKVRASVKISVSTNLLKVILLVIAIQFFHSLVLVFYALVLVAVLQLLMAYLARPKEIRGVGQLKIALAKKQIQVGIPLGIASILGVAFKQTDSFMISSILSIEEYAIYRNGAFELPFIGGLYSSIGLIILPDVAKLFHSNDIDSIVELKRKVVTHTAALIIPIVGFILFFSEPLIITYMSEKYAASSSIFMTYSLILLIRVNGYQDVYVAANKNIEIVRVILIAFILNIPLNYFFLKNYGSIGAALATVISMLVFASLMLYRNGKFLKRRMLIYFNFSILIKQMALTIGIAYLFRLLWSSFELPSNFIILFLGFYMVICLHLYFKMKLVDIKVLSQVLKNTPIWGNKMELLTKKLYG